MGKKKKHKKHQNHFSDENSGLYNQKRNEQIADQIERFIDIFDEIFIVENCSVERYNHAMKVVRKAIKRLRKGEDLDKVFNFEAYEDYLNGISRDYTDIGD